MRIKKPVLLSKVTREVFEVDVEGTKVIAVYEYDLENEASSGWEYDLSPCFVDLDDDEVEELQEEFQDVLSDALRGEVDYV